MALLQIRKYGDPVLRQKAKQIDPIDDEIVKLAEDMIETMQVAKGIGLAAPQIGLSLSMCVVDIGLIEEGASPEALSILKSSKSSATIIQWRKAVSASLRSMMM